MRTNQLTPYGEQSPCWEANSFSASQEIPHTVWNPKVHHRVHKSPPLVSILSQISPVHSLFYFLNIHFNIILHLRLGLLGGLFPSGFPTITLSPYPYVPHAPPISLLFI
jgi:hypothetical protein